jgi:hypothetical protein
MTNIVNYSALKCQSARSALPWCTVTEIVYKMNARCSVMSFSDPGHHTTSSTRQIGWIAAEIADHQMECALNMAWDSRLRYHGR